MKNLSNILLEKLHINKDININNDKSLTLTDEELNYKFKVITVGMKDVVKDLIEYNEKHYQISPKVSCERLKNLIIIDKLLVDNKFSQRDKASIKELTINDIYFIKTNVNRYGYCVVYDPFDVISPKNSNNFVFLVGKCKNLTGKTINPLEWIETKEIETENHRYDNSFTKREFFDTIEEAWDYITKKYGKF